MKNDNIKLNLKLAKNQLNLYGYNSFINGLIKIYNENKFPKQLLITGPKGSGKSTSIYHLVNYFLSVNEEHPYDTKNFTINPNNYSYKLLAESIHPNFFLLKNDDDEKNIKIDKTKQLIKFLNKSTYSKSIKIVMIDNAELLNINASNALLKVIEEPDDKTFFLIIQNTESPLLSTIKSRCIEHKVFLNLNDKIQIFKNLYKQYFKENNVNIEFEKTLKQLNHLTPGNLLKILIFLKNNDLDLNINNYDCLKFFLNKYAKDRDSTTLALILFFIQVFYRDLAIISSNKINKLFYNYSSILVKFKEMKTYNLDIKNIINWTTNVIENEQK